jgi:hypothetical protein
MDTLRKTVTIPANRRLHMDIDVPARIPPGEADVLLIISPKRGNGEATALAALAGCLAASPIFSRDPVALQKELRDEWD